MVIGRNFRFWVQFLLTGRTERSPVCFLKIPFLWKTDFGYFYWRQKDREVVRSVKVFTDRPREIWKEIWITEGKINTGGLEGTRIYISRRAIVEKTDVIFEEKIFDSFAFLVGVATSPQGVMCIKITNQKERPRKLANEVLNFL